MKKKDIKKRSLEILRGLVELVESGKETLEEMTEEIAKRNQWIDLDIDNLPERFFTRHDIEIECQQKESEWTWQNIDLTNRAYMIMNVDKGYKYRYRIQEKKEPAMYITKSDMEALSMYYFNRRLALIDFAPAMNREVIIID